MKIGVVLGSIREGRTGESVAQWVLDSAKTRSDAEFELIDLSSFNVPLLTAPMPPAAANRQYEPAEVQAWSKAIDACDGYIFVTAEYNHSIPGAFKNAVDSLGPEWQGKSVALVSYGADSGVRAVEHWRTILANFSMTVVRAQVSLSLFTEFGEQGFQPNERRDSELSGLIDQLLAAVKRQNA